MNVFDAAVCIVAIIAVVTGYNSGLLRSVATILGYLSAMPIAVAATSYLSPYLSPVRDGQSTAPWAENSLLFFALFLVTGMALGTALRLAISETVGPGVSIPDRLAGSALGAIRIALVAVTIVLIFDQLIPPDRQPGFLVGSKLRPILSVAGQKGLKSLPPDVTAYIDRLKRDQRI
jgi:membrane protein required for colicin V production